MIWKDYTIIARQKTGTDKLKNPIYGDVELCTTEGRITQWTATDVDVLGRDFTVAHRKLLLIPPNVDIPQDSKIQIDGVPYDIKEQKNLDDRYLLLYVKGYRV